MAKIRKVINDPQNIVPEMIDGLVLAYHGKVRKLPDVNAIIKTELPPGKVGLLIGGGSGHEPIYHGLVGDSMGDAAAIGNIFAAPSPDIIFEATKAVNQGKGVLYLYGNYSGDNMNFDIASELSAEEGIDVRTVRIWDDVASSPPDEPQGRRGIAGLLFIVKIAGAVSSVRDDIEEVFRVTSKARDNTRTMGVALSAGSIPETGEPTFILAEDEIEIGMGLHGEPGVSREKTLPADPLVEKMMGKIIPDLPFENGDEVCLLINSLGSTTTMELLIVNRKVRHILAEAGIHVYDTVVGSYSTSQEMAGFSISLMRLDDELKKYYDMPANSFGYEKG